ncbi:uncharacterized protein TNCV_2936711 [Trichonephila clavipes]|nr:uncharacterized protein TNCV_2936711 [Trichonephila clavipes]
MAFGGSLPQINLGVPGVTQGGHHNGAQRVNPEFRVGSNFRIIPEQYFSGVENVVEFLKNRDNNLTYYEIPTQLACADLKGHFPGRALDWFEVLGYRFVESPDDGSVNVTICEEGTEYVGRNIEKLFDEARQNRRKQHKHWEKYYNRKRREVNIKVNDLVLVQTHFISAAGRRVVGKFMPKFEGPYRVLEVRNNNLIILKRGKKVTVNIDQVRVYRPRQSDTISSDSHVETLYEGQSSSDRSSRSQPGKFKGSRKTSSEQNNGHKSSKGNAGWEDPRLKRKVEPKGSGDKTNFKKYKICRKRSLQASEHRDQKRPTPESEQGIKRAIPSSVSSRNHKYRRSNNPSQGSQPIAGPSHQQDSRQGSHLQ